MWWRPPESAAVAVNVVFWWPSASDAAAGEVPVGRQSSVADVVVEDADEVRSRRSVSSYIVSPRYTGPSRWRLSLTYAPQSLGTATPYRSGGSPAPRAPAGAAPRPPHRRTDASAQTRATASSPSTPCTDPRAKAAPDPRAVVQRRNPPRCGTG